MSVLPVVGQFGLVCHRTRSIFLISRIFAFGYLSSNIYRIFTPSGLVMKPSYFRHSFP